MQVTQQMTVANCKLVLYLQQQKTTLKQHTDDMNYYHLQSAEKMTP